MRRSVSQPFIRSPSQLPKFVLHTIPQVPPAHDADALGRAGHMRPQPPQFDTLTRVSTHDDPHIVSPDAQPVRHVPAEQICTDPQAFPQRPQLCELDVRSTSQPFAGFMSQSAKPMLQVPTAQRPAAHAGIPFAITHDVAQAPQCAASVRRSTSQPFAGFMSQSAKPSRHAPSVQTPIAHDDAALGSAHTVPHAPQFESLVAVSASQPLAGFMSQSAKPALHTPTPQRPATHEAVAFCAVHALAHAPQFAGLALRSVSQPLAGFASQSP